MSAIEGLIGEVSIGGSLVGFLTGVNLRANRASASIRGYGTFEASHILKGIVDYNGAVAKAYICNEWLDNFRNSTTSGGVEWEGTFYPRGTAECGTIAGKLIFTSWNLDNWVAESEAAKIENLEFILYSVTTP